MTSDGIQDRVEIFVRRAKEFLELDDHSGALEFILQAHQLSPDNPQVREMLEKSERTLLAMYESKLGRLDAVPKMKLRSEEIFWLNLDHRAGFVLAQVDGTASFEDLFSLTGMPRLETARILVRLLDEGVIAKG